MGCLDFPSEGKVLYQGRNLLEISEREAKIIRNREICLIPQQIFINTSISVYDNVSHVLKILGEPDKDINRKVEFWLKELNIWNKRNMLGFDTTASEKLLISIARAMIKDPKILLLDEPLADKDIHDKIGLQALLNRINRKFKVTVIHATKNWELASESDVIILLNGGTVTSTQERNSSLQMAV
jgi:putative ABC transport system ATP-binding protein